MADTLPKHAAKVAILLNVCKLLHIDAWTRTRYPPPRPSPINRTSNESAKAMLARVCPGLLHERCMHHRFPCLLTNAFVPCGGRLSMNETHNPGLFPPTWNVVHESKLQGLDGSNMNVVHRIGNRPTEGSLFFMGGTRLDRIHHGLTRCP